MAPHASVATLAGRDAARGRLLALAGLLAMGALVVTARSRARHLVPPGDVVARPDRRHGARASRRPAARGED